MVSTGSVTMPIAADNAVQPLVSGLTSGRTAGSLSSSLSRLNFYLALEDYYEYVPSAHNYNTGCPVVYVAHNDRHRSSALISSSPPWSVLGTQYPWKSDCQSGPSKSRLLASSFVSVPPCAETRHLDYRSTGISLGGFHMFTVRFPGIPPRLPPTVNTLALVPRSSRPDALSCFSALVALMAIFKALSI